MGSHDSRFSLFFCLKTSSNCENRLSNNKAISIVVCNNFFLDIDKFDMAKWS